MKRLFLLGVIMLICGCAAMQNDIISEGNFSHEIKKIISQKSRVPSVNIIEGKLNIDRKYKSSVIHIKGVRLEDFVQVVFTEILKYPYILDRSIERLDKKIDIEISRTSDVKNLFAVVVSLLEKSGVEVEDVEGVLILSVKSKSNNENDQMNFNNESTSNVKKEVKGNVPSNCVYTYHPVYVRAVDLQKSLSSILLNDESKVIVHEQSNCLIVRSTDRERRSIVKLLRVLDEKQKQIAVDVTLAEVSLTGELSVGLEGFLKTNLVSVNASPVGSGYLFTGSIMFSDWLKVVLEMGSKNGLIKIRSNPYLLIADGSSSSIEIGSEYPVLVSQKSSGDTSVINSVEYRKTGILLNIKPIVSGDSVHLESSIELSEGQKNEISTIQSPAILNRKIKSSVVLESGQSLIIGGLISETKTKDESFFPGFGSQYRLQTGKSESMGRIEIVVCLHVSVISDDRGMDEWFERLAVKYENQQISYK